MGGHAGSVRRAAGAPRRHPLRLVALHRHHWVRPQPGSASARHDPLDAVRDSRRRGSGGFGALRGAAGRQRRHVPGRGLRGLLRRARPVRGLVPGAGAAQREPGPVRPHPVRRGQPPGRRGNAVASDARALRLLAGAGDMELPGVLRRRADRSARPGTLRLLEVAHDSDDHDYDSDDRNYDHDDNDDDNDDNDHDDNDHDSAAGVLA